MAGLIASAIGGAGEGMMQAGKQLGDYAEKSNLQQEAAEIQRMRDATLADLKKGEITAQANAKVDVAERSPRTLPAGASEVKNGEVTITAPEKAHPPELLEYYAANARRLNAEAKAIEDGLKYKDKGEKPRLPSIKVETNKDTGEIYNIDQNSGAIGTIVPSQPAVAEKTHWVFPNEPGKAAQPASITWRLPDGRVLPNGLADLYPDISARTPDGGAPAASPPAGGRPPLASFQKTSAPGPTSPAAAPPPRAPASAPEVPDMPGGADVDTAKSRLSAAKAKLQSYGLLKRKDDPAGLAQAQKDVDAAQQAYNEALSSYQKTLGPMGAARFPVR